MSNISFTKSRSYEQFFIIFHIASCIICIIFAALVVILENGKMYIPPIFIIAGLISFLNAFDKVYCVNNNSKALRRCIHLVGVGVIAIIMAILTIICFWL